MPFGQEEGKGGGADADSTPEHEHEEDKEMADEEALYDPTKTEEEDLSEEGQDDDAGSVVGYDPLTGAPKKK